MASTARLDELKKKFDENPRRYFAPLANEHRKSGDLDQAISLCRTHLPQQPGHISGHIVLAQALFEAGSLEESREQFHAALSLDPENLIALRYLGDIAKESSDIETARTWYQRVLEVDPRNEEIEQLVRDLDAPPAVATEASTESTAELQPTPSSPEPPLASPKPVAVENDARFAPLPMDEIDFDDLSTSSDASADAPLAPAGEESIDIHGEWSSDAANAGLPLLDTPEIDPFEINPAASAEALYDPNSPPPKDDIFAVGSEGWSSQSTTEPAAAQPTSGDGSMFDEGSFYLEPPPPAPGESTRSEDAVAAEAPHDQSAAEPSAAASESSDESHDGDEEGMDAFAAEYYPPAQSAHQRTPLSSAAFEPAQPEPNAEELAGVTEAHTAEWQPVSEAETPPSPSARDEGLGLEVMEFVPPSSEPPSPAAQPPSPNVDPLLGRTLDIADPGATPAAFVTETMAELYLQQGFRNEALAVYRELLARNPGDASLRERVAQIESGSMSSLGMATLSENVVESALKRQTTRPTRTVRSFFASLAGRRAPAPPQREIDEPYSDDLAGDPPADEQVSLVAPEELPETIAPEPVAAFEPPIAEPEQRSVPDQAPLTSAAESLASFNPFAATPDSTPSDPEETPNAEPSSLEDLFPDTPMPPRTEAAAQTLATAFGRPEPQGRPTRAASNELSLDHVFRGTPEGAPAPDGGFSFDQFFSDSRASEGAAATPTTSAPESGRNSGSTDAHDIEQFTAWLEGLKKK